MLKISNEAILITKRFFFAIEILILLGKLKSVNSFTTKYNINYWNLCTLRNEPERRILKVEYLYYLVTDYNISAKYLLTGIGNIFAYNENIV